MITKQARLSAVEKIFQSDLDCSDCQFYIITHDMYGTGDSPTGYECDVCCLGDCSYLIEAENEAAELKNPELASESFDNADFNTVSDSLCKGDYTKVINNLMNIVDDYALSQAVSNKIQS